MALINCPECGKEISDKAVSCPNCGTPINNSANQKFCQHCGEKIDKDCIICPKCGKQVSELSGNDKNIIINNSSSATAAASSSASSTVKIPVIYRDPKNKWVSLCLCIFLGYLGAHKFYEGKTGMGILYIFTIGLFGIGWIADIISIAMKPNPYYV